MGKTVRGLVLAGGGAKGSYQVGVYKALRELGWQPDIITGASVGSLNGVMFTQGAVAAAEHLWLTLEEKDVMVLPAGKTPAELRDDMLRSLQSGGHSWEELQNDLEALNRFVLDVFQRGGLDVRPLGELIDGMVDENAVRASKIRFGLVITRMEDMKSIPCPIESIPAGQLREYMLASSACFPALRPQEIDGVKYIDGGWRDNMPWDLAAQMGATELIAVDIDGIGVTRPNTTGLPTKIIRSHWDLGSLLDFDGLRAKRNIALGYQDTMRAFGRRGGTAYGLLPDTEGTLQRFIDAYLALQARVTARAPALALTEPLARQTGGWPPVFARDPAAPTRGAAAPLELAAQRLGVPPEVAYTPRDLAMAVLASAGPEPAQSINALLDAPEGPALVAHAARLSADPAGFVTALVCRALWEI